MAFNHTLTRAALRAAGTGGYDVIHAHDWLVAHTAMTLREHLDLPLVSTIHATEAGRHQGWLPGEMNRTIHGVEHWLGGESTRVIVCSGYMRDEVTGLFGVPAGRVDVVPNGVEPQRWRVPASAVAQARARFAADGPLVTFAGRLVYEKGVQHLLAGLPRLRERHPGLRAVIVGDGPYRAELEAEVHRLGLTDTVSLPGFLGGTDLPAVMAASDCFAVPSIYEPFGMVALEGAAAGAPLAVAETGGLAEIVEPGVTGMTFRPHDPDSLADAVHALLSDTDRARTLARRARTMVARAVRLARDRQPHRRHVRRGHRPVPHLRHHPRHPPADPRPPPPHRPGGQPPGRRRPPLTDPHPTPTPPPPPPHVDHEVSGSG